MIIMSHISSQNLLLVLFLLCTSPAIAQNDQNHGYRPKMLVFENLKNDTVLNDFHQRFRLMERVIFHPVPYAMPQAPVFGARTGVDALNDSLYRTKTALEMQALNQHTGFEVTGQALRPFGQEGHTVSVYR